MAYIVWFGSLTLTELAWTVVGVIGLLVALWNFCTAVVDSRYRKRNRINGPLKVMAKGVVEQEFLAFLAQVFIIIFGVATAVTISKAPSPGVKTPLVVDVLISCLFGLSSLVTIASILRRYRRGQVVRLAREAGIEHNN